MKHLILTVAALTIVVGAAIAQPNHSNSLKASHTKAAKAPLICPITGDKIASTKVAVGHTTYKGKTYYFCCPSCKPRFDKDPAKAIKNAAAHKYEKM